MNTNQTHNENIESRWYDDVFWQWFDIKKEPIDREHHHLVRYVTQIIDQLRVKGYPVDEWGLDLSASDISIPHDESALATLSLREQRLEENVHKLVKHLGLKMA